MKKRQFMAAALGASGGPAPGPVPHRRLGGLNIQGWAGGHRPVPRMRDYTQARRQRLR
jgi:hypothetical protein